MNINESHGKKHNGPRDRRAAERKGNRDAEREIYGDGFKSKDKAHKGKEYNRKEGKRVDWEEMNENTIRINEADIQRIVAESVKKILKENDFSWNKDFKNYVLVDDSCDAVIQNYTSSNGYDAKQDAINDADEKARETRGGSFSVFGCANGMYNDDTLVYCTSNNRNSWKF